MNAEELRRALAPFADDAEVTISIGTDDEFHIRQVFYVSSFHDDPARLTLRMGRTRLARVRDSDGPRPGPLV